MVPTRSIHSLPEGDKKILIMQNMGTGASITRKRLAETIGLESLAFHKDNSDSHRTLWKAALDDLISAGYITLKLGRTMPEDILIKQYSTVHENTVLDLEGYTFKKAPCKKRKSSTPSMLGYDPNNISKEKIKNLILSVIEVQETVSGKDLYTRLNVSRYYFSKSMADKSSRANKWAKALEELAKDGYIYIHPTCNYKITKLKDMVDQKPEAEETPDLHLEKVDFAVDATLAERLSIAVENLLVIAREAAEDRVRREYEDRLDLKDGEIKALREELKKDKKPSLFNLIK